jgi:hypothetical protein
MGEYRYNELSTEEINLTGWIPADYGAGYRIYHALDKLNEMVGQGFFKSGGGVDGLLWFLLVSALVKYIVS